MQAHGDLRGTGLATVDIDARDLSRLRGFGLPSVGGALRVKATVRRERALTINVEAQGHDLRGFGTRIDQLGFNANTVDWQGQLRLATRGARYGRVALDHLWLDAHGSRDGVAVELSAVGPRNLSAQLALHGRRAQDGGVTATLDRLQLHQDLREVHAVGAAHFAIGDVVSLDALHLQSGTQELTVGGRYVPATHAVQAHLVARGLDAAQAQPWLPPSVGALPKSAINVTADVTGTVPAPVAKVAVDGHLDRFTRWRGGTKLTVDPLDLQISLAYARREAQIAVKIQGPAIALAADAHVPLPGANARHAPEPPIHANVDVRVAKIEQFAALLPPRLAGLRGQLTASAHANGTLRHPDLDVKIDAPWDWTTLTSNHTTVTLAYHAPQLALELATTLRGGAAGKLHAKAALPVDLGAILTARDRSPRALLLVVGKDTPLSATVELSGLDLEKLDVTSLGLDLPLTAGALDAKIDVGGTALAPVAHLKIDALHLQKPGINAQLDVNLQALYEKGEAHATAIATLAGAQILKLDGQLKADTRPLFDGKPVVLGAIAATVKVPTYDLSKLRPILPNAGDVAGQLALDGAIDGPLTAPHAKLRATLDQLALGGVSMPRVTLDGEVGHGVATAAFDTKQANGGTIHAGLKAPLDGGPLSARLDAHALDLAFLRGLVPQLSKIQGRLDAALTLTGPPDKLVPAGTLTLADGALTVAGDPHTYDQVSLSATVAPGLITLRSFAAHSGKGWLKANGTAQLVDGLSLGNISIDAYARQFMLTLGSAAAWLDADITVRGERQGQLTKVVATVKQGTVNLPKIEAGRSLQSTGPLKYVTYDDKKERAKEHKQAIASTQQISAHIPGPFLIRSKEANIDLKGDIDVNINGANLRMTGTVQSTYGWVDLFGRRYEIERAAVIFSGNPSNPHLDIRISRAVSDAVIGVGVSGTASKPKLDLTSNPPVYDESDILVLVLSGDPGNSRASEASLNSEVVGTISGLVVSQIKNVLAPKLPIDVIKINNDEYSGIGDTRLEVGKYITQNIYVSYVHQFGTVQSIGSAATNANEAHLEYRFLHRYELDTSFGDNDVGGIDLYWTTRF